MARWRPTGRGRLTGQVTSAVSLVLAAALGIVSGVATESLAWLGNWSWAVVAALVAAAVLIQVGTSGGVPDAPAAPDEIPRDVPDFTGREAEMLELRDVIRAGSSTLLISAIDGTPGVGKSTLQIHLAHKVDARFPDARLYANLRGGESGTEPVAPQAVLEQFLRSLGERDIPRRQDEAERTYRSLLAGKRALILLDNASSAEQVRPLLPGSRSCTVVITSRTRLTALEGAHRLTLQVFSDEDAVTLLQRIVGEHRVREDERATADVVRYCGRLPLALRIAGSRMAQRDDWTMATLAGRLSDERERLAVLSVADLDVRASFMISYRELDPSEQRTFRLVAAARTAELPSAAAACASGLTEGEAKLRLDRLVELHLLEPAAPDGVQFHDLLRLFARERSAEEDTDEERDAALGRVLEWYLGRTIAEPASWLDGEQENVLALIEQAATAGERLRPYCWRLAFALAPSLAVRGDLTVWQHTARTAETAAAEAGDPTARALARADLGRLHEARGELPRAEDLLRDAVRRLRGTGAERPLAQALLALARVRRQRARLTGAHEAAEEALRLHRASPERPSGDEAACLVELGDIASARGDAPHAAVRYEEVLEGPCAAADGPDPAPVLARLGDACRERGDFRRALDAFEQAARRYAGSGDEAAHATMLEQLGLTHDAAGRPGDALTAYGRSQEAHRSLGRTADECRLGCNRAVSLWRLGRTTEATSALEGVVRRAEDAGARAIAAEARLNLGAICLDGNGIRTAESHFDQACRDFRAVDDPAGEARALSALARARVRAGDGHDAIATLSSALRLARRAQDGALTAGLLVDLAVERRDRGERDRAGDLFAEAVREARALPAPDPELTARALLHLGGIDSGRARIAQAAAHFDEARTLFRAAGDRAMEATALMYLGKVRREGHAQARYAESAQAYEEAARLWHTLGDGPAEGRAAAAAAVCGAHLGDGRAAERALTHALTLLTGEDAHTVRDLRARARDGGRLPTELPW